MSPFRRIFFIAHQKGFSLLSVPPSQSLIEDFVAARVNAEHWAAELNTRGRDAGRNLESSEHFHGLAKPRNSPDCRNG
ncbi:MAG: hypothetical protein KIT22_00665 [Verrucomicrobiae bacterium]|nr:hypothetical protein [Verrucomicrobiae bacterium]